MHMYIKIHGCKEHVRTVLSIRQVSGFNTCDIILLGCILFCALYDVIKLLLELLLLALVLSAFCTLRYKEWTLLGPW